MPKALLVVAKQPMPGQVKTRLGDVFDPDTAAQFYQCLVQDTLELMGRVPGVDKGIVYTPDTAKSYFERMIGRDTFVLVPQRGPDLGARLLHAFQDFLSRGYEQVVIIDSDSPTVPVRYLERAFSLLDENDVVFGPCDDGGYYLVGATKAHPNLFLGIEMSTPTVLQDTLERASALDLRAELLPMWYDVDFPADLVRLRQEMLGGQHQARHTARFFNDLAQESEQKWSAGASEYADYVDTPAGRMRSVLMAETLERHLPDTPLDILEIGCGLGQLAGRLAERGHRVIAIDSAREMIRLATERAAQLSPEARSHLDLRELDLFGTMEEFAPGSFQCLILHTVLDYLEQPSVSLKAILSLLSSGGILSIVRINHVSEVLRAVLNQHDPEVARHLMATRNTYAKMFDSMAHTVVWDDMRSELESLGLDVMGTYGIRIFSDYLPRALLDDSRYWEEVLRLERRCCGIAPYNAMGRYVHVVTKKN